MPSNFCKTDCPKKHLTLKVFSPKKDTKNIEFKDKIV